MDNRVVARVGWSRDSRLAGCTSPGHDLAGWTGFFLKRVFHPLRCCQCQGDDHPP